MLPIPILIAIAISIPIRHLNVDKALRREIIFLKACSVRGFS